MENSRAKKILIVDDELLIAESEKMDLEAYGYKVDIAESGEKAVGIFQKPNDIELVLMDIDLGSGIDGTIAAKKILDIADIPIIFMSSHSEPKIVKKTEDITSYGYIVKDSSITVIDASIKMAFRLFAANLDNRKKEQALLKSEKLLRYVMENTRDFAYKLNLRTGSYDYVSPVIEKISGFTVQEFSEMGIKKILKRFHPNDRAQYKNNFNKKTLLNSNLNLTLEYRWKHKDGAYHWYSDNRNLLFDDDGNPASIVGNVRDITDKKYIEQKLRQNETELRSAFTNIIDGVLRVDKNLTVLEVNPAFTQITGIDRSEVIGKNGVFLAKKFVNFRDLPKILKLMSNKLQGKPINTVEFAIEKKVIEIRVGREQENGEYIVLLRNITKEKETEQSLLEIRENYNRILQSTPVLIYRTDENGIITFASPSVEKIIGYKKEDVLGKDLARDLYVNPDERELLISRLKKFGSVQGFEARLKRPDGSVMWISTDAHVMLDKKGNYKGVEGIARNITKQKISEEVLRDQENAYRATFENTGTATVILDEDRTILLANNEFEKLSGLSKPEIEGKRKWTEFVIPEDLEWMQEQHDLRRKNEQEALHHYEFRFLNNNKDIRHIFLTIGMIPNSKKSIASLLDITDRKEYEKKLKEKEHFYRAIFENTGTAIAIVSKEMYLESVNNEMVNLSGYSKEEMENKYRWTHFVLPEDLEHMMNQHQLRRSDPHKAMNQYEFRLKRKNGEIRDVFINIEMIPGTDKSIASMLDITERKKAESDVRSLLKEKELILKEVHHRIKNNLTMVKSLINIQKYGLDKSNIETVLSDVTSRIDSIILLYDNLFLSKDYKKINAKIYFDKLVQDILRIYPVVENINIGFSIEDLELDVKVLSSLGIITSELMTNSIKYAFPKKSMGKVNLNLHQQDNILYYTYWDNGVGIQNSEDKEGFGLSLISILVQQLQGKIDINTDNGVHYSIEIELNK